MLTGRSRPLTQAVVFSPWPTFEEEVVEAVTTVLRSGKVNYWTGEEGKLFEKEFATFCGCKYAVALANGTVALELALAVHDIGPGDEVIVTSRTFIASASAIVMRGARPVMADVDPVSQNITAETIAVRLSPRTKAVICVHLAGWPCDMDPIMNLAADRSLVVIEDCAQAHGATYKGRSVGSLGHVAAWSFCQDKIMSTGGEGGMLTTNDPEIWRRAWSYKDHGKDYDTVFNKRHPPGFRWLHESFGTNWRMTEMQSAIGRRLLAQLPQATAARRRNATILNDGFAELTPLRVTIPPPEIGHAYYKYYVFVEPEKLPSGWDRDRIMTTISVAGVPCYSGSCSEIYLEQAFKVHGLRPVERLPVARRLGKTSLMFLVHPTLGSEQMHAVIKAVRSTLPDSIEKGGLS